MRILLDEHLNWRLTRSFGDRHVVRSVRGMGWTGKRNGDLLRSAERLLQEGVEAGRLYRVIA